MLGQDENERILAERLSAWNLAVQWNTELVSLVQRGDSLYALSPDGRHLAVSVDARRLQMWDLSEVRKQLHTLGLDWVD